MLKSFGVWDDPILTQFVRPRHNALTCVTLFLQVKAVATQIPRHVLEEGMRRTAEAIRQLYVPPTQP